MNPLIVMLLLRAVFTLLLTLASSSLSGVNGADVALASNPNPARFAAAIASFQAADTAIPPPTGGIVCIGSSSMRMWHSRIYEDLPGLTLLPRGFGGSHYSDVIYYVEALILKYQPRAVLLYEGDNDAAYGKSPERIFHDFKLLTKRCREKLPQLRLYVIGAKPSPARWDLADKIRAANAMIEAYCRAEAGFTYIDVWPFLLDANGQPRSELFLEDRLHLNAAGYDQWASAIVPVVQQAEVAFE
jgi:lysophospholipase L1-like esterase